MSFSFMLVGADRLAIYLNDLCSVAHSLFRRPPFCNLRQNGPEAIIDSLPECSRIGLDINIGLFKLSSPTLGSISRINQLSM